MGSSPGLGGNPSPATDREFAVRRRSMEAAANAQRQAVSPDAFAAFYDKAFSEVYRYLSAAVFGDQALAEDLTQETFASVVTAVRDGRAGSLTMPWLMGVAPSQADRSLPQHVARTTEIGHGMVGRGG